MTSSSSKAPDLRQLAEAAGIAVDWRDAQNRHRTVSDEVLVPYLAALGLAAETELDRRESLQSLLDRPSRPALTVVQASSRLTLDGVPGAYRIRLENGTSIEGQTHDAGQGRVSLVVPTQPGYHHLEHAGGRLALAVSPGQAPGVADIMGTNARIWGPVAQLYSLRQDNAGLASRASGFGDFTALAQLARAAAAQGAHALAISPVHAMFAADPGRYSPYGPSSRLFVNTAYADPAELFGQAQVSATIHALGLSDTLLKLDAQPLIDWPAATQARQDILRALCDDAYKNSAVPAWHEAFEQFLAQGGETLQHHACFEALHAEHLRTTGSLAGWRDWPQAWRDPNSASVAHFAREHRETLRYHALTQWLATRGLAGAQSAARAAGMGVGLIADLAVGTDPGGSHAWSRQSDLLQGLSSGAPPDIYNPLGQGWGLTAFSPSALRANGYAAFIEMLRAVLANAGGIRIDHVLGLARTWLIPDGNKAADGAYLRFPLQDMLQLTALEAWRHHAIVIGENLGTVPEGFNDAIGAAGMLGMNVLLFERGPSHHGAAPSFKPASQWPRNYLATSTTHDLPTLAGWWAQRDLDWKVKLDLLGPEETEQALRDERHADRRAMHEALAHCGALDASGESDEIVSGQGRAGTPHTSDNPLSAAPVAAMLDFTTRGPQPLALIPLEDILALIEQPNIPGTIDAHPNWRRRLPVSIDALFDQPAARTAVAAITSARSSS